jgi:hypothetical protein
MLLRAALGELSMGDLIAAAKALQEYGFTFIAVIEAAVIIFLYRQSRATDAARITDLNTYNNKILEIATKSIEADKDNQHAVVLLAKALESRPHV